MHTPDEYSSSLPAAADPPADQKVSGVSAVSDGPSPPPHRTSESGHPLEELEATLKRQEAAAESAKEYFLRGKALGWKDPDHLYNFEYEKRKEAWWKALARRANTVWDLDQKRNPVSENRSSPRPSRLRFAPQCEANDGTIRCLSLPSRESRRNYCYDRRHPAYVPGTWAAGQGFKHTNTSWYTTTASWERELKKARKMKKSAKQLVKPSASLADSANPTSDDVPAPALLPRRHRDQDDNDNGGESLSDRPASPKRVRLSPPPKSSSSPVSAASTFSRPSILPAVGSLSPAQSASLSPPSPRPWAISSQKRRRDDEDDNHNDEDESQYQSPKRIRLSTMPLPKRAGSAPPALATGPVLVASPAVASLVLAAGPSSLSTTSSASQVPAAAPDSPSRQASPPPQSSPPAPSPSPSGSSPSSLSAAAAAADPDDQATERDQRLGGWNYRGWEAIVRLCRSVF
ncbi:hypothetical protein IWZ01DRAFT_570558 [Phyllosticta capitalensis]